MPEHFHRYLWISIGIILGSFVVFGGIFYLLSQSLAAEAANILADRAVIAQRSADLESESDLKANVAAAMVIQKKMDVLLVSQDGLINFPQFLQNLARTHALTLTFGFDGSPVPAAPPAPGYVMFSATAEGSPENIRDFMGELENKATRFLVNLQQLNFSPDGTVYRADLKGQVFFQ